MSMLKVLICNDLCLLPTLFSLKFSLACLCQDYCNMLLAIEGFSINSTALFLGEGERLMLLQILLQFKIAGA
jgi:hypothetical protein